MYFTFEEEDSNVNITIDDIHSFIDTILNSSFLLKAQSIVSNWLSLSNPTTTGHSNYPCLLGCLKVLCGISKGSVSHCEELEKLNLFKHFADIFTSDTMRREKDLMETLIHTIGNIAATMNEWTVYYIQCNFHN